MENQQTNPAPSHRTIHATWMIRFWDADNGLAEVPYAEAPFRATSGFVFCSHCRTDALLNRKHEDEPSNFCPECGADMWNRRP